MFVEHDGDDGGLFARRALLKMMLKGFLFPLCRLLLRIQPRLGGDGEAGLLKPLLDAHDEAGIDIAGACSALHGFPCPVTKKRDFAGRAQRQRTIVFKEHHALARHAADGVHMRLLYGRNLRAAACVNCLHDQFPFLVCKISHRKASADPAFSYKFGDGDKPRPRHAK